jgi:carbohydrate diacid regulator
VANVSAHFAEVAYCISTQLSKILAAPVFVVDAQGDLITSSGLYEKASDWELNYDTPLLSSSLRLPIKHRTEQAEVIIGEPSEQKLISPKLAQVLVELFVKQFSSSSEQTLTRNQLKNKFIEELLQDKIQNEAIALSRAKQLGIDLAPPRTVILINAKNYILEHTDAQYSQVSEIEQNHRTQTIIRSVIRFFHLPDDTICAELQKGELCVLKASDTKNLDLWVESEALQRNNSSWANLSALKRATDALLKYLVQQTDARIDIGIGRYHPGVEGLARSYEDARAALSLGSRLQQHNQVHCLGELGIAAFVGIADETTKIDLAKYLLSPLDYEPELLMTLDIFFAENCCPSSSAKRLLIHRNTLSYRLDKIFSLTSLDPRKFDHAVQMRLCLLLRSLTQRP